MTTTTVTFRSSKAELMQLLRAVPGVLSGRIPDPTGSVEGLNLRLGMGALGLVKEAFDVKSAGGTDESGMKWAPLSPVTIARRRQGPKDKKALSLRSRLASLSPADRKQVMRDYRDRRALLLARGVDSKEAGRLAAGQAVRGARRAGLGVRTKFEILASRDVPLLKDTGRMYGSLGPGQSEGIFKVEPGRVSIGTNVVYAAHHMTGTPHMPARPLWPPPATWPPSWWQELAGQYAQCVQALVAALVQGGKP